jgi:hypothetical protein
MVLDQEGNFEYQYTDQQLGGDYDLDRDGWVFVGYWYAFRQDDIQYPSDESGDGPADLGYQL